MDDPTLLDGSVAPSDDAGGGAPDLAEERRRLRLAQQDPAAFLWFYDKYYARISRFLRGQVHDPDLADDLTARTFFKALAGLNGFRWLGLSLGAWLHQIAMNEARIHWRTLAKKRHVDVDAIAPLPDPRPDALEALAADDEERRLRAALARMDETDRTIIVLHYWEELGVAEIAQLLDRPQGTIQARLKRARDKLKVMLVDGNPPTRPPDDDLIVAGGKRRRGEALLRRLRLERDSG